MARWFGAPFLARKAEVAIWRAMMTRMPVEGYLRLAEVLRDTDLHEETRTLRVPTLAIVGDLDAATPPETLEATAALIDGAGFERLAGVGHLPPIEVPETVSDLIAGFMAEGEPASRYDAGMEVRRRTLGHAHVDRASQSVTPLDAAFQRLITEGAWGSVWASHALSPRERSQITLALLAALGHWEELDMHLRATRRTGATQTDIAEALMHVAIYAGVPAANHAFKIAKETMAEEITHD